MGIREVLITDAHTVSHTSLYDTRHCVTHVAIIIHDSLHKARRHSLILTVALDVLVIEALQPGERRITLHVCPPASRITCRLHSHLWRVNIVSDVLPLSDVESSEVWGSKCLLLRFNY